MVAESTKFGNFFKTEWPMIFEDTLKREFKGIWIPAEIWEDETLTVNEKILYLEIDSFSSHDKSCFVSNEHISTLLHISENAASKVLNSLVKKGLVSITKFDGRKRYIQSVAKQHRQKAKADSQNEQPCIGENAIYYKQDNNTSTIITSTNVDVSNTKTPSFSSPMAEKNKEKEYSLSHKCRLIFESAYKEYKKEEYYYGAKDASAIKGIIKKIQFYMPDDEKEDEKSIETNFQALVNQIMTRMPQLNPWIYDNLSLPIINSKFNEIYTQLKNHSNGNYTYAGTDPNCRVSRDYLERTMREAGLM